MHLRSKQHSGWQSVHEMPKLSNDYFEICVIIALTRNLSGQLGDGASIAS